MKYIILFFLSFQLVNAKETKNTKEDVYKKIMNGISTLGESLEKKPNKEMVVLQKITSLLSWNFSPSANERVNLTSGVFAMIALEKTKLNSDFEKKNYSNIFDSDSFGSAFLYKKYIVTNFHMCRGLNTIIRDYKNQVYSVKVLKFDEKQDICVLEAPKGVLNQRNFASYKISGDPVFESKRSFQIKDKLKQLKSIKNKNYLTNKSIKELEKELLSDERDYAQISGAYGEFFIYKIKADDMKDDWSKNNAFYAYGSKCKGGVSGSPVVSKKGIIGIFWGAENKSSLFDRKPATEIEKYPTCYFVGIDEVEKIINSIEK